MSDQRPISNENEIKSFFHCGLCMAELPRGTSPREYGSLEIGFTPLGVQVWCKRHEVNVAHIDFEGQRHPANLSRKRLEGEVV